MSENEEIETPETEEGPEVVAHSAETETPAVADWCVFNSAS